jgi:hypothetical protein
MIGSIILCNTGDLYQIVDTKHKEGIKIIKHQVVRSCGLLHDHSESKCYCD